MLKNRSILLLILPLAIIAALALPPGEAATAKKEGPKKPAAARGPAPVPARRVLSDFASVYRDPDGFTATKSAYIGVGRNFMENRNGSRIPVQVHRVAVNGRLTACGLPVRNTWEARYYRLETEWIFQDITLAGSAPSGKPSSKLPGLDDEVSRKLIRDGFASQYGVAVTEVTLLGKKGTWALCVPTYRVTAKVVAAERQAVQNTVTLYECLVRATIAREKDAWNYLTAGCVYRAADVADCHIPTMCRSIATNSSIPSISDDDARTLLRESLENVYALRKNNISVEKFALTGRLPAEMYGTTIPCVMSAQFVIDEYRETPAAAGSRSAVKVRAVYECAVTGRLRYSLPDKAWEGLIDSCCAPGAEGCGLPCSAPSRGCRRLGEK